MPAERFIVEIVAEPSPAGVPAVIRLRQWLKIGLRGLKLRALSVGPGSPADTAAPTPEPEPKAKEPWWDHRLADFPERPATQRQDIEIF